MIELENITMIDFLRKNQVSIDTLPELVKNLPSIGGNTQENNTSEPTEGKKQKEDVIHDGTTKN